MAPGEYTGEDNFSLDAKIILKWAVETWDREDGLAWSGSG
jgi:hypothetical protein